MALPIITPPGVGTAVSGAKSILPKTLSPIQRRTALSAVNRPDPLQNWRWICSEIPQGGPPYHYVETADIPFNNIGLAPNWHTGSGFTCFPGTHTISTFNCSFYEDNVCTTLKWLTSWKSKVKNFTTGIYGLPKDYKANWVFILLDSKNQDVLKATLIDCWPSDTNNLSLSYANADRTILTQTFAVDDLKLEFLR